MLPQIQILYKITQNKHAKNDATWMGLGPPKWPKMGPKSLSKTILRSHSISSQIFVDFATIFSAGRHAKIYQKPLIFIGFHQIPHVQLMRNIRTPKQLQNVPKMAPYGLQNLVLKPAYLQHRFHVDFESI